MGTIRMLCLWQPGQISLIFLIVLGCHGNKFRLGAYYQSGMVLQSGGANIWGWGGPHADVQILSGETVLATTRVDNEGRWLTRVELEAGGQYNLTLIHRWLSLPNKIELAVLAGEVWLCVGSDNMAMPMAGVIHSQQEIRRSLNYTQVRYAEVNKAWTEEPQLDLIGGLSIPWQAPNNNTLPLFSSTCFMFGRDLHDKRKIPVGLVGIYVNQTDLLPWTPLDVIHSCKSDHHLDDRGLWNAMLFPFLNSSAKGGILYEGQVDVERGDNLSSHGCMLSGTINTWMNEQNLTKLALVTLGNNQNNTFPNNQSWPQLRWIQANTSKHIQNTVLVPSHDLQDPGHRLSRHKADLASRIVNMTASPFDQAPSPPSILKSCYVYIYISLEMTEEVILTEGYKDNGFQSCCRSERQSNESCFLTGPNGDISVLAKSEKDNGQKLFLFDQSCRVKNSNKTGLVTEIYYGWNGRYPYMKAPLYGAFSKLPATSSFVPVIHDSHDPNCVH